MINIYEKPIMPVLNTEEDVLVYVPGYSIKGPEYSIVDKQTFTSVLGEKAYVFKNDQSPAVGKNELFAGAQDRSWFYAKGLVDSGLKVLFHRIISSTSEKHTSGEITLIDDNDAALDFTLKVRSKFYGGYYSGMRVSFIKESQGITTVKVEQPTSSSGFTTLETKTVSFASTARNFIGSLEFDNIEFITSGGLPVSTVDFDYYLSANPASFIYFPATPAILSGTGDPEEDEFTVADLETKLETDSFYSEVKDTDQYSVTYLTSGGYFQTSGMAGKMMEVASQISAVALTDFPDDCSDLTQLRAMKNTLQSVTTTSALVKSFGTQFVGCDTFFISGVRIVLPDSFGYLTKLGNNLSYLIPAWVPVANNSNGNVSLGIASTRPVKKEVADEMTSDIGVSINPIVKKQNIGYVIMGNRTLYPNTGILGPQSFLNCRLVVNTTERVARKAASALRIVSTNSEAAFKAFRNQVEKTLDMMLVNGDGLNEYSIKKLPKTKPATLDIGISLTVVEGIETFNIYLEYAIQLD